MLKFRLWGIFLGLPVDFGAAAGDGLGRRVGRG